MHFNFQSQCEKSLSQSQCAVMQPKVTPEWLQREASTLGRGGQSVPERQQVCDGTGVSSGGWGRGEKRGST